MIPGIDPKVDIAFKKVFGSPQWTELTIALIDAVLQPPPWRRLVELELLNPYSEKMSIDDKVAILDIKARDERGRLFNLEMQMVPATALTQRFLYYWARLYTEQLSEGQNHDRLCPAISICFVNGSLFDNPRRYHRQFRLLDVVDQVEFTADQEIHLLELPNFRLEIQDLRTPLDLWLYFFKNGERLDADALPEPLAAPNVCQAMEVLKMFSQEEMARELYEGRLKARRDAQDRKNEVERTRKELEATQRDIESTRAEMESTRAEMESTRAEIESTRAEMESTRAEMESTRAEMESLQAEMEAEQRRRTEAEQRVRDLLVQRIEMCQRMLGQTVSDSAKLAQRGETALQALADRLAGDIEKRS